MLASTHTLVSAGSLKAPGENAATYTEKAIQVNAIAARVGREVSVASTAGESSAEGWAKAIEGSGGRAPPITRSLGSSCVQRGRQRGRQ